MSTEELLPCPFCGNKFQYREVTSMGTAISCACGIRTMSYRYHSEAIAAWNRRSGHTRERSASVEPWGYVSEIDAEMLADPALSITPHVLVGQRPTRSRPVPLYREPSAPSDPPPAPERSQERRIEGTATGRGPWMVHADGMTWTADLSNPWQRCTLIIHSPIETTA